MVSALLFSEATPSVAIGALGAPAKNISAGHARKKSSVCHPLGQA